MKRLAFALLPKIERAFPLGWQDVLIKAAIHHNDDVAFASAQSWLAGNSIDTAPFRDHRLLLAVVARFGERLATNAAYPRLRDLQRMLWVRSRGAVDAVAPTLRDLAKAGIEVLLIKGAARFADDELAARGRVAHDIDIVVRPDQSTAALDVLAAREWAANKGFSHLYLREHLNSLRSINMWRGERGDIDLHTRPFPAGAGTEEDDRAFWSRTIIAELSGVRVLVPALEDRLALALGVNGLQAHEHSDWLVDSAAFVATGRVSWELFMDIVARRRLTVPAAIAIGYLANELSLDIPGEVVERLTSAARVRPLAYYSGFLHARPDYRASIFGRIMRGAARHVRRQGETRALPRIPDRRLRARNLGTWTGDKVPSVVTKYEFDVQPRREPQRCLHFSGVLFLPAPIGRRRIEFELNGRERHICRIRYRKLSCGKAPLLLGIEGEICLSNGETGLVLESRPSRQTRAMDREDRKARYEAVPFHVLSLDLATSKSG